MHTPIESPRAARSAGRILAWGVHVFTASGVACAFLAMMEVAQSQPDPRWVFAWLMLAVLVDALDGPLARRLEVKRRLPWIDGRTIDDLVDYLTFTFVPLLLVARMGWVLEPVGLFIVPAMMASTLGFANTEAKQEREGFFRGFPSYWNIFAFHAGPWVLWCGPVGPTIAMVALTILTVLPVRFLYPNLAPRPFRAVLLIGAYLWMTGLLALLPDYPAVQPGWFFATLAYPGAYVCLSIVLDVRSRRASSCRD